MSVPPPRSARSRSSPRAPSARERGGSRRSHRGRRPADARRGGRKAAGAPARSARSGAGHPRRGAFLESGPVKVLALDFGAARTGVAVSDPTGTLARPLGVVERAGTDSGLDRLAELVRSEEAERVVVGFLAWGTFALVGSDKGSSGTPDVLPPPPKPFKIVFPEGFTRRDMGKRITAVDKIALRERGVRPRLSRAAYVRATSGRRVIA